MPLESRFGLSSPRYGQRSVHGLQHAIRAQTGPADTVWGQKLVRTRQQSSPNIAQVDSVDKRGQRIPPAAGSELPGWARFLVLGQLRARRGPLQAGSGRVRTKGGPKDGWLRSPHPSGGPWCFNGEFHFSAMLVPVAGAGLLLAAAARHAGSPHCPNQTRYTNRRTSYSSSVIRPLKTSSVAKGACPSLSPSMASKLAKTEEKGVATKRVCVCCIPSVSAHFSTP